MKNRDSLKDPFISDLIKRSSTDAPPEDFVKNVMTRIEVMPAYGTKKKPFFYYVKNILPWLLVAGFVIVVFLTSDISLFQKIPGMEYFQNTLIPSISESISSFNRLFSNRFLTIGLAVVIAGVFLFGIEKVFNRKKPVGHHYMI